MSAVSSNVVAVVPSLKSGVKKNPPKATPKVAAAKSAQPTKVVKAAMPKVVKATTKGKATAAKSAKSETPTPRKGFTLTDEDLEHFRKVAKENKGKMVADLIPHNRGNYRSLIESLLTLGKDKAHPFAIVRKEIVRIMSDAATKDDDGKTAWQRFNGKESDSENGLKTDARIHQNAEVLQRLGGETPYGLRLMQIGTKVLKTRGVCIDILKGKDGGKLYRLNTNAATPINEFRRQRGA